MTKDEFIERYEQLLHGVLFEGFVVRERDPAWIYRRMQHAAAKLKTQLGHMFDALQPAVTETMKPQPQAAQPQPRPAQQPAPQQRK